MRAYKKIYDKEQLEYFKSIVKGHFTNEISDLFYKKYGIRYKKTDIENIKRTYKLYSNVSKCKKGEVFVKPYTRKKGEERISSRGWVEIKVSPKKWEKKHHYVWEKHNGKIPKNHFIGFKDGNPLNCDINNLELISYADRIIFNFNKLDLHSGEEILKTNLLISELMQKKSKIKKRDS